MDCYQKAIKAYEKTFERIRKNQWRDKNDPRFGGYYHFNDGITAMVHDSALGIPIVLYYAKESKYYKSEVAWECAMGIATHFLNHLHDDGTMDYFECNFHSAPDNAFFQVVLARVAKLITVENEKEQQLKDTIYHVIERVGEGLLTGGFHTPNHRWIMSAALALTHSLMPNQKYLDRIEVFLREGIDCNEDGEYTERSTGTYNYVNNLSLILLAQELGKTELLEYVRKNLMLMLAFVHSDLSIFTENSTRQDKGQLAYLDKYVYQYLYTGYALKDTNLQAIGQMILQDSKENGRKLELAPYEFIERPEIFENLPSAADKSILCINRHFKESGVLRLNQADMNLWVVENSPSCVFVKLGNIDFYIKGGISFFNCRHLTMQNINPVADGYTMTYEGSGSYRLPFDSYPGTSDWRKMPHDTRKSSEPLTVKVKCHLTKTAEGFDIHVTTEGCKDVPIRFEIGVFPNVRIYGDSYSIPAKGGYTLIPSSGNVVIDDGNNKVAIGPAFAKNQVITGRPGTVPASDSRFNIFFTDETNFDRTISIKNITPQLN
jgi:hypothetical protein